jgi:tetratricopeptide (TPR) repeat protein
VYGRALGGDFVLDDWPVIKENSRITETRFIPDYFVSGVWSNTDLGNETASAGNFLYRPLFMLVLNLGYQVWGDSALAFHAVNIVLHAINTILLFYIILGLVPGRNQMAAFFGATLFAVHPVHVESIAWIAGLTDPLVSVFLLSTFLLYRRYLRSGKATYAILALACYAAGLLSKEVAVFFPAVLIVYDWLSDQIKIGRLTPYAMLLIGYFMARSSALGEGVAWASFDFGNLPVLIEYFLRYIQLLLVPWPLDFYFAGGPSSNLLAAGIGGVALLGALAILPRAIRDRDNLPVLGVAWFSVTILPALPIALLDAPVFAIRVLYLPSAGLAFLGTTLYMVLREHTPAIGTAWGLIAVFAFVSIAEIRDWKDDVAFHLVAMNANPHSAAPNYGLARAYERDGKLKYAAESYMQAAELTQDKDRQLNYLEDAAFLFGQRGDIEHSEQLYRLILDRKPGHSSAWVGMGNNAWARNDMPQAIKFYLEAYEADPSNHAASYNLAMAYRKAGNVEQALHFDNIARRLQEEP